MKLNILKTTEKRQETRSEGVGRYLQKERATIPNPCRATTASPSVKDQHEQCIS